MLWTSHLLLPEGTLCPWGHDWPKVGQARNAADSTPQEISSTSEGQELMYKCSSFHSPWGNELRSVPHSLSEACGVSVVHSNHVVVNPHSPPFPSRFLFFTLLLGITSPQKCLLPLFYGLLSGDLN